MIRKDLIIAVLATFCLTATLFMIVPTRSASTQNDGLQYDPWKDTNDDGKIDIFDIVALTSIYGKTGTPINKTQMLLDLQNRVSVLEEKQDCIRTIRFYTPNETMADDIVWIDAAIIEWVPKNATNNAILQGASYFQYLTPDPANYQLVFRILINDFVVNQNSVVNYTTEYQQTAIKNYGSWQSEYIRPNQSTYTVRFQIRCATKSNPMYAKDINILLEVMDGLPPS
jgi:hypothetical protein